MVKEFWRYVYSFWQNVRTWQTDGHTDRHRMRAKAALMHSIARQTWVINIRWLVSACHRNFNPSWHISSVRRLVDVVHSWLPACNSNSTRWRDGKPDGREKEFTPMSDICWVHNKTKAYETESRLSCIFPQLQLSKRGYPN